MVQLSPSVLTGSAVAATAVVGGIGAATGTQWYRELDKPAWQPPGAVFGPVWTVLYAALAVACGRVLGRTDGAVRRGYGRAFTGNLVLNAGWTWAFFRRQRPGQAVGVALALDASTASLIRAVGRHDRAAGAALVPYLAWTLFATALTEAIWFRNTD